MLEKNGDSYTNGFYATKPLTQQVVTNSTIELPAPPTENQPEDATFAGWRVGTPTELNINSYWADDSEGLRYAGTDYIVSGNVSLTARYTGIKLRLADDDENAMTLGMNNGKQTESITLNGRTLAKNGEWNTLCLPFYVVIDNSPLKGADVRTLVSSSFNDETGELTLNFSKEGVVNEIMAGVPYIIKWNNTGEMLTNPSFNSRTISNTFADVKTDWVDFVGIYSPEVIYEDAAVKTKLYLGAGNKLYYPASEDFAVNACRAYFQLKNGLTAGDKAQCVRSLVLNLGEEETTGVRNTHHPTPNTQHPVWYSIDGHQLNGKPTKHGVYIQRGNKVIIK